MKKIELNIIEDILTRHLSKGKGELFFELLKNTDKRESFLNGVKKIFLYEKNSNELLADFFISHEFSGYFFDIEFIKEEYIERLSEEIFLKNIPLETISLLKSDKTSLANHVEFLSYLKKAYKIQGRKELKQHLLHLDELSEFDLSEEMLKKGAKYQIRNELKSRFNDLDDLDAKHNNKDFYKEEFRGSNIERMPFKVSKFLKYGLAAIFIGIVSVTSIIYNFKNNDSYKDIAYNKVVKKHNDSIKTEDLKESNFGLAKLGKSNSDQGGFQNYGLKKDQSSSKDKSGFFDTIGQVELIHHNDDENTVTRGEMNESNVLQKVYEKSDSTNYLIIKFQFIENSNSNYFQYIFNSKTRELKIYSNKKMHIDEYRNLRNRYYIKTNGVYYQIKETSTPMLQKKDRSFQ